jgi:hypothetical protein
VADLGFKYEREHLGYDTIKIRVKGAFVTGQVPSMWCAPNSLTQLL